MPPLSTIFSTDHWSGGDDVDITGRQADGGGDTDLDIGEWATIVGQLDLFSDVVRNAFGTYSLYSLTGLGLDPVHGAQAYLTWPGSGEVIPPTACVWLGTSVHNDGDNPSEMPYAGGAGHDTRSVWWQYTGGAGTAEVDALLSNGQQLRARHQIDADGTCHVFVTMGGAAEIEGTDGNHGPVASVLDEGCCYLTYVDTASGGGGSSTIVGGGGTRFDGSTVTTPSGVTIVSYTWSVSGGCELRTQECGDGGTVDEFVFGSATVGVRASETEETAYLLEVLLSDDGITRDLTWNLWAATAGAYVALADGTGTAPAAGVAYWIELDVDENDVLSVYLNSTTAEVTFDPHTELDGDGNPVDILTGTATMLGLLGDAGMVVCTEYNVLGTGTECEGPPDNPWPTEPPNCPPPEPEFSGERPHQIGQWRETIVPSNAIRRGLYRQAGGTLEFLTKWVMQSGIWREIIPDVGDTDPPCDPPDGKPPYYDPCENYPPLPEPPTEPLGPPPDRLFFAYDLPITTLGQIYTAAVNATGPWSTLNLSQAVARSGYIIGGIGGYSKYQSGGQYQRSLMTAWIDSHASYMPAMVAEPFFYGQICMDDHAARERWNWPSSFSDQDITNEISFIAGYWKAAYPGIRVGIRAREAQWSGSYPSSIDFMVSQFRYWGLNRTPSQFVSEELGLANSRGHDILFSINFENGGLGPSSPYGGSSFSHRVMYEVGAGELQTAWLEMIVDTPHMHGIGGWKYSAEFLSHSGILDAHAVARNALAAIGPP